RRGPRRLARPLASDRHTAGVDPAHGPVARVRDGSGFVGEAEFRGKEPVSDQLAVARSGYDDIRLPGSVAGARRRAVQQIATMSECSIDMHESSAPDCLND